AFWLFPCDHRLMLAIHFVRRLDNLWRERQANLTSRLEIDRQIHLGWRHDHDLRETQLTTRDIRSELTALPTHVRIGRGERRQGAGFDKDVRNRHEREIVFKGCE